MTHVSIRLRDSRAANCCDSCVRFCKSFRFSKSCTLGGLDRRNLNSLVLGMAQRHAEVHARWTERSQPGAQHVPAVLTIAGSDSGGGAGIQADLKTFAACGVFGTSAITALTAQNTQGVFGIEAVSADFVSRQIDAVLDDIPVTVVKTGMLPSLEVGPTLQLLGRTDALKQHASPPSSSAKSDQDDTHQSCACAINLCICVGCAASGGCY